MPALDRTQLGRGEERDVVPVVDHPVTVVTAEDQVVLSLEVDLRSILRPRGDPSVVLAPRMCASSRLDRVKVGLGFVDTRRLHIVHRPAVLAQRASRTCGLTEPRTEVSRMLLVSDESSPLRGSTRKVVGHVVLLVRYATAVRCTDGEGVPAARSAGKPYFLMRFGVCDNALAAADFAALPEFALRSTLLAAFAAFALVCLVFLFAISLTSHPCAVWTSRHDGWSATGEHHALDHSQCLEGPALQGRAFVFSGRRRHPEAFDQNAPTHPGRRPALERTSARPTPYGEGRAGLRWRSHRRCRSRDRQCPGDRCVVILTDAWTSLAP